MRLAIPLAMPSAVMPSCTSPAICSGSKSPEANLVKYSMPTARTSGSAYGSLMRGLGTWLASARCAATIVAVAPTLEARSQLSSSVRAIPGSLFVGGRQCPDHSAPPFVIAHPWGRGLRKSGCAGLGSRCLLFGHSGPQMSGGEYGRVARAVASGRHRRQRDEAAPALRGARRKAIHHHHVASRRPCEVLYQQFS
ncbi:Uncharacterised protein [Mycobacteroides abscessus subsp. abscessus]|nr:Uncharacterised protein [Mycobacteroides abscessus subsp. abscessus]